MNQVSGCVRPPHAPGDDIVPVPSDDSTAVPLPLSSYMCGIPAGGEDSRAFFQEYLERCGQMPQTTFRTLVVCIAMASCGAGMMSVSFLDYLKYYVSNDINFISRTESALRVPKAVVAAFVFPTLGCAVDTVSRRLFLCIASWIAAAQGMLLSVIPSGPVLIVFVALNVVGDAVATFLVPAILRDLFPKAIWESRGGGFTAVAARIQLAGGLGLVAGVIGAAIVFTASSAVTGHASEFDEHSADCSESHCELQGRFSLHGAWGVDGSLRFNMLLASALLVAVAGILSCRIPETLRRERCQSPMGCAKSGLPPFMRPWSNLAVFATMRLRLLLLVMTLQRVQNICRVTVLLSLQRRLHIDAPQSTKIAVVATFGSLPPMLFARHATEKFGDLRGIWIPGLALSLVGSIALPLIPEGHMNVFYLVLFLAVAPGSMLLSLADALPAKLFPHNLQATWRTGRDFIFHGLTAALALPCSYILEKSEEWPYPFDLAICWIVTAFLLAALLAAAYVAVALDPRRQIEEGRALADFSSSCYALARCSSPAEAAGPNGRCDNRGDMSRSATVQRNGCFTHGSISEGPSPMCIGDERHQPGMVRVTGVQL